MPKIVRLNELFGSHSLSVPQDMHGLLRHRELTQLTWQFGSELRHSYGETVAEIEPPIPRERVAEYGEMVIALARRFEPEEDFHFIYNERSKKGAA